MNSFEENEDTSEDENDDEDDEDVEDVQENKDINEGSDSFEGSQQTCLSQEMIFLGKRNCHNLQKQKILSHTTYSEP